MGLDRDEGGGEWDGWCRVGVSKRVCVCVWVCECVMVVVLVGSVVRVATKSKSLKSFDEHQSVNITATHSSIVHSQPHYQHNPCYSVEVATIDRAMFMD